MTSRYQMEIIYTPFSGGVGYWVVYTDSGINYMKLKKEINGLKCLILYQEKRISLGMKLNKNLFHINRVAGGF
jgi:hypothetical protein